VFIIHELRDDTQELLEFLAMNKRLHQRHISYNGLEFDSQITELILREKRFKDMSTVVRLSLIYNKAQSLINSNVDWPEFPEWN